MTISLHRREFLLGTVATAIAGPSGAPHVREQRVGDFIIRYTEFDARGNAIAGTISYMRDGEIVEDIWSATTRD